MNKNKEAASKIFMNKYVIAYIYISSILAYFMLSGIIRCKYIHIALVFRVYYICLSIVLLMLLRQGRKFNKKYVSKIVISFLWLMILICILGFLIDINKGCAAKEFISYIHSSRKSILLIESFAVYALSEYYVNKIELKKWSYIIIFFVIASAILVYFSRSCLDIIKSIYTIIEVILFLKIILNLKAEKDSGEDG